MGYRILKKKVLAPKTVLFEVDAAQIASKAKAGQFIILRVAEHGERIPLTIAQTQPDKGRVTIVVQELGKTTFDLNRLEEGDEILDFVGPLGKPTHIQENGTIVCVGGGVGNAVVWAQVQGFKEAGNRVLTIIGARNKEMLILENEIGSISDELIVTTDDGSYGRKGVVTEALAELLAREKVDEVVTIGPPLMMRAVSDLTRPYRVKTVASLNSIMVDATGMCGACMVPVTIEGKMVRKHACIDGPELDAHLIDWDKFLPRFLQFRKQEDENKSRHGFG